MKKINIQKIINPFVFSLLIIFPLLFSSCGEDPSDPPQTQQEITRLIMVNSPWKMTKVTVDGFDQTNVYRDLVLTFLNTQYTSVNGKGVWPETGFWSFDNTEATAFLRSDGLRVEIQNITETSLRLSLDWDETTYITTGRTLSLEGQHVFEFGK
ncbi:hypothetical protein [Aquiflexum sp.]|uniref:hypothetical protein n=1 Tax=Aquiflexum sp. TaxID=1872584 RepID=UPI0035943E33